jgi:hypothetical protein
MIYAGVLHGQQASIPLGARCPGSLGGNRLCSLDRNHVGPHIPGDYVAVPKEVSPEEKLATLDAQAEAVSAAMLAIDTERSLLRGRLTKKDE